MAKPSGLPAWGGGSGARLAHAAVAQKLRTVKDKQARSSSSMGFRSSAEASASSQQQSWGFAAAPEPCEDESCPAATPAATPTVTPTKATEQRAPAEPGAAPTAGPCGPAALPAALLPNARATLEALASQLGAAARGSGVAQAVGGTWEEAFLAGVAVGLQLPAAGRRQSATQRALLVALLVCGLVVLGGSALLLVGVTAEHPRAVYYT